MLEKSIKKIIIPSIRALLKKAMLLFFVLNPAVEIVVKACYNYLYQTNPFLQKIIRQ